MGRSRSSHDRRWHWIMAIGQIAVLTTVCMIGDVWRSSETSRQFPGHLGPSIFVAAIGVGALCTEWTWWQRCEFEGRTSVIASIAYISGETLESSWRKGFPSLSFYVKHGLHAWMAGVVGLCGSMLVLAPRLERSVGYRLKDLAHLWFAVAWAWFIYQHKQPNDLGASMHWTATTWILIGGFLRVLKPENPKESGAAYIIAAYTFFGGQTGLTLLAAQKKANVGSYVLMWHAMPIVAILLYVRLFHSLQQHHHQSALSREEGLSTTTSTDIHAAGVEEGLSLLEDKRG